MHPHIMRLCRPDLNEGTRQSSWYFSSGRRHTIHCLDSFPISTDASSVQIILSQSSNFHPKCSHAHLLLARHCLAVRNGFLTAIWEDRLSRVCIALETVRGATGAGRARLIEFVISWSVWCLLHVMWWLR